MNSREVRRRPIAHLVEALKQDCPELLLSFSEDRLREEVERMRSYGSYDLIAVPTFNLLDWGEEGGTQAELIASSWRHADGPSRVADAEDEAHKEPRGFVCRWDGRQWSCSEFELRRGRWVRAGQVPR